jgi:flagellin
MNINTNMQSLVAGNALKLNNRAAATTMEQLSSGKRINSASNDAAGLAVSQSLTAQSRGLNMAVRNANDAISMAQTAEGALIEVSNMLQRMRELAVQAATGTISPTQRTYLATEAAALADQIDSTITNTLWNGTQVLGASAMNVGIRIQVGADGAKAMGPYNNVVQTFAGSNQVTIASLNCGLVVGDTVQISQQSPHDNI